MEPWVHYRAHNSPLLVFFLNHLYRMAERFGDRILVGRDFPHVQTGPRAHPTSCTMGTGSFPWVKYGRGVLLTTHPLLVPRTWKSRAIPLPTLWTTTSPVTGTLYLYLYHIHPLALFLEIHFISILPSRPMSSR